MATYVIRSDETLKIDYALSGEAAKLQTMRFLLGTFKYNCPLGRAIGWEPALDAPINVAPALNVARITALFHEQMDGVTVESIETIIDAQSGKSVYEVVVSTDEPI